MEQDNQKLQMILVVNRQELHEGFNRIIALPGGEQVTIRAFSGTASDDKISSEEGENHLSRGDDLIQATPILLTEDTHALSSKELEKTSFASKKRSEDKASGQVTSSRLTPYVEASMAGILIGGLVIGLVLYTYGRLPTSLIILASTLAAMLTLIVSSWGILVRRFFLPFRKRWRFPSSFIFSIAGLVIVAGIFLWSTVWRDDPYHHLATPVFSDSLQDGQNDNYWSTGTDVTGDKSSCTYNEGSYLVRESIQNSSFYCVASSTDFDNFVYEVKMSIVTGDCGGIMFRADAAHNKYYFFELCSDKTYSLYRYDKSDSADTLQIGTDKYMKSFANNQDITIAVVARGTNFELYIDHALVDTAFDTSGQALKQGEIGVEAHNGAQTAETQVRFKDAQVWQFK